MGIEMLNAQADSNNIIDLMTNSYSARTYTSVPVTDSQIDMIIKSGLKAPSAVNAQPWRFTVVKDNNITKDLITNITPGNIVIVISGIVVKERNPDLDCALATQNMYLAAQALGLGSRIYTGPVKTVNAAMKDVLGIPSEYRVVALLRVGNIDKSVDATSAASTRKKPEEVVDYK